MPLITLIRSLWSSLKGRTTQADPLDPPEIAALLPDLEGGETHLLRFSATHQPLEVRFKMWKNSNPAMDEETLTLYWDDTAVAQKSWTAPVPEDDLFLHVPQHLLLSEGRHTLFHDVELYNGNHSSSLPFHITIDRTPPQLPADNMLVFDPEVVQNGVTDAYLVEHNEELEATVPLYSGIRVGDVLTWYWSTSPSGMHQAGSRPVTQEDINKPLKVIIPGKHIRDMADGLRYARYTVQDYVGTPELQSQIVLLDAKPTPLPVNFSTPYLKETGSTGSSSTLDPVRASNGATVIIKAGNPFEPADSVRDYWANPGEHGAYDAPVEVATGDIACPIPRTNVAARMGSSLALYYTVTRRGTTHTSGLHTLTVRAPNNLPAPQCEAIQGGELSLTGMGAQATFTLNIWPLRDTSQFVRLHITGKRNDGGNGPVVVTDATPVTSATGIMTVGSVTPAALGVFTVSLQIDILCYFSVDNKLTWIPFPHVPVKLVD
jgi:hypothetical protein